MIKSVRNVISCGSDIYNVGRTCLKFIFTLFQFFEFLVSLPAGFTPVVTLDKWPPRAIFDPVICLLIMIMGLPA